MLYTCAYGNPVARHIETLERAREIGYRAGLKYIYMGNIGGENNTYCPECGQTVIRRSMTDAALEMDKGVCRHCGKTLDGRWK